MSHHLHHSNKSITHREKDQILFIKPPLRTTGPGNGLAFERTTKKPILVHTEVSTNQ